MRRVQQNVKAESSRMGILLLRFELNLLALAAFTLFVFCVNRPEVKTYYEQGRDGVITVCSERFNDAMFKKCMEESSEDDFTVSP